MSRFLFDQIDDLESRYRDAKSREDAETAWRILREAARIMYMLANRAEGKERRSRMARADAWVEKAGVLRDKGSFPRKKKPEPAEDGSDEAKTFQMAEKPNVSFEDIAGLSEAKEEIRIRMVYPFTHPELAQRYGVRTGGGLLLYGPPGTGKTLLARAVAGEIDAPFFTVKPSEIMSKWVGEAEKNIEKLFTDARAHTRAVIFIDEVEALVPKRTGSGSSVMKRVVPQILAELEGVSRTDGGALLFIGATNEPWSLDAAVLRPGRFDALVYVGLPDLAARRKMLDIFLAGKPLDPDVNPDRLADAAEGFSGADIRNLCERTANAVFLEAVQSGELRDIETEDFAAALADIHPSVRSRDLTRFDTFRKGE
jgi:transitional endoplasmic reticulum ATPase